MHNNLRDILFRDPLFKQAGLQYVWPLDEATGLVRQSYSQPWACVPSAHMQPVNGPTQGSALIAGPAGAASFTSASSQYLTQTDASLLRSGSQSFWVSGWIYSTTNGIESIFAKGPQSAAAEFVLYRYNDSALYWLVGNNSTFGQPTRPISLNTTTFFLGWYDATAGKVGLRLDHGTISLASYTGGSYASIYPLQIGAGNSTNRFNGRIGPVMYGIVQSGFRDWDKLSQTLYANGAGLDLVRQMPLPNPPYRPIPGIEPILWCEADYGTYQTSGGSAATADGDPVGYWTDRSSFATPATQSTSTKRATLKTSQINGYPALRFDGVDDYLSGTFTRLEVPFTMFFIAKTTGLGGTSNGAIFQCVSDIRNATFNTGGMFITHDSNPYANILTGTTPAASTWELRTCTFNGASSAIRKNGAADVSGNAGATTSGTTYYIGNDNGLGRALQGDIAAIMVYPGALTAAQIASVETYLNTKYAVY